MDNTSGIVLEPVEIVGLWSLQGNRDTPLTDLVDALFATSVRFDEPLLRDGKRLLPLWPQQAYLLSGQAAMPQEASQFAPLLTDISHGYSQFHLGGAQAFDFIASYLSVDIAAIRDASACRRCLLGQYRVILWWDDRRDIQLLLERSYAQSFADYIGELASRQAPAEAVINSPPLPDDNPGRHDFE